ncbi:MAG: glycosyltransferase family 4 protein [Cellvibrionaceae bacterium]|nr:glycosyltransferase family 4 protein [Cellvibrionaceae bacterium]
MERLNWHIANGLAQHTQVTIIGPKQSLPKAPANTKYVGVPLKPLWRFIISTLISSIWVSIRCRPEIVFAGSGLTAPMALIGAKLAGGTSVAYLHGLDIAVNHPLYRLFWLPAIRRMDKVIVNSSYSAKLAQAVGVPDKKISVIHPGVTLPKTAPNEAAIAAFRAHHKLGNSRLLLSVGRLTERKGLREFVRYSLPDVIAAIPDAVLVVIGDQPKDSLYAKHQSITSIQAEADNKGVGDRIRFLGWMAMNAPELQTAFYASSVHIFPVKHSDSDPEGFGMVAVEAAAQGLPTVAFASGGILDAVSSGQSGYLVEQGNYSSLTDAIVQVLVGETSVWRHQAINFAQQFAWPLFNEKIVSALNILQKPPSHDPRSHDG